MRAVDQLIIIDGVASNTGAGGGAVALDAVSTKTGSGLPSDTWRHTPAGVPTAVAVCIGYTSNAVAISSITYGGVPMNIEAIQNSASGHKAVIYGLANPPPGPQDIAIVWAAAVNHVSAVVSVVGSHLGDPFSNNQIATGTSTTPSLACTSAVGELVVDVVVGDTVTTFTQGAGQTKRWDIPIVASEQVAGSTEVGAASVTMSWTLGVSSIWAQAAASFRIP
jgi:hypothetical protein